MTAGRGTRRALGAAAAAVVAAAAPRAAHAQPPAVSAAAAGDAALTAAAVRAAGDRRLVEGLDGPTYSAVRTLVIASASRGLPPEPLVTKAVEGVEKGAPNARVEAAVRALAGRLAAAREALRPAPTAAEVVAGADALSAGAPADALTRVRAACGQRSAAVALGVLAQLVTRGVPTPRAVDVVVNLVKRGASNAQLAALDAEVERSIAAGATPAAALDAGGRALADGALRNGAGAPPLSPAPPNAVVGGGADAIGLGTRGQSAGSGLPTPPPPAPRSRRP